MKKILLNDAEEQIFAGIKEYIDENFKGAENIRKSELAREIIASSDCTFSEKNFNEMLAKINKMLSDEAESCDAPFLPDLADVHDDGVEKPWLSAEYWKEHTDDSFDIGSFDTISVPPDIKELEKLKPYDPSAVTDNDSDEARRQAFIAKSKRFFELVRSGNADETPAKLLKRLKKSSPNKKLYKKTLHKALKLLFSDYLWDISLFHLDLLPLLLSEGADLGKVLEEIDEDDFEDASPVFKHFAEHYCQNPDPAAAQAIIDTYFTGLYSLAGQKALALIYDVIDILRKDKRRITRLEISVDSRIEIYSSPDRKCLAQCEFKAGDDIENDVLTHYMPDIIRPMLSEQVSTNAFDDVCWGEISFSLYKGEDIIFSAVLDEALVHSRHIELSDRLNQLKNSPSLDIDTFKDTVNAYMGHSWDPDVALDVVLRYLYSENEDAESAALSALYKYTDSLPQWKYEHLLYQWAKSNFSFAHKGMVELAKYYEPAKSKLDEWEKSDFYTHGDDEDDEDAENKEDPGLYGIGKRLLECFSPEELLCDTDTISAKADLDGTVYIRFKIEGEQGYSDAIAFLNRINDKGYSKITKGYALAVRFLAEPYFMAALKDYPKIQTHAFFAKAALYPSLHDALRELVFKVMHCGMRCHNMAGHTVAGTFEASVLALSDIRHMDIAVHFGKQTNGEYEVLASWLALYIIDRYGISRQTIPAIYELVLSYAHRNRRLPRELYMKPENLEAVMDYYNSSDEFDISHKQYRFTRFVDCMIPVEDKLQVLKDCLSSTDDKHAKAVYRAFCKLYQESL